jgi:hypothetical protein
MHGRDLRSMQKDDRSFIGRLNRRAVSDKLRDTEALIRSFRNVIINMIQGSAGKLGARHEVCSRK